MTDRVGVGELLAWVEAATGADREIDLSLEKAFSLHPQGMSEWRPGCWQGQMSGNWVCPNLSASLDAALELVERRLPGWRAHVSIGAGPSTADLCRAHCYPERAPIEGATPALALLAALLKALIAEAASPA